MGRYDQGFLMEDLYIDPAFFSRIPAGKIPVISNDARLKIENKIADIVKKRAEDQRASDLAQQEREAVALAERRRREAEHRSSGEIRPMEPSKDYCHKATGLSQAFAENVGSTIKVAVSSVKFLRAEAAGNYSCWVTVDTAKGPKSCGGAGVYSDGKDYWVHGGCF
jgi:hypothetical protein